MGQAEAHSPAEGHSPAEAERPARTLTLPQAAAAIARHGKAALLDLARRGELDIGHVWLGVRGTGTYLAAIARGDVAGEAMQEGRLGVCAVCPARTGSGEEIYCGPPLEEHAEYQGGATCGCALKAKTAVKSEACVRGLW